MNAPVATTTTSSSIASGSAPAAAAAVAVLENSLCLSHPYTTAAAQDCRLFEPLAAPQLSPAALDWKGGRAARVYSSNKADKAAPLELQQPQQVFSLNRDTVFDVDSDNSRRRRLSSSTGSSSRCSDSPPNKVQNSFFFVVNHGDETAITAANGVIVNLSSCRDSSECSTRSCESGARPFQEKAAGGDSCSSSQPCFEGSAFCLEGNTTNTEAGGSSRQPNFYEELHTASCRKEVITTSGDDLSRRLSSNREVGDFCASEVPFFSKNSSNAADAKTATELSGEEQVRRLQQQRALASSCRQLAQPLISVSLSKKEAERRKNTDSVVPATVSGEEEHQQKVRSRDAVGGATHYYSGATPPLEKQLKVLHASERQKQRDQKQLQSAQQEQQPEIKNRKRDSRHSSKRPQLRGNCTHSEKVRQEEELRRPYGLCAAVKGVAAAECVSNRVDCGANQKQQLLEWQQMNFSSSGCNKQLAQDNRFCYAETDQICVPERLQIQQLEGGHLVATVVGATSSDKVVGMCGKEDISGKAVKKQVSSGRKNTHAAGNELGDFANLHILPLQQREGGNFFQNATTLTAPIKGDGLPSRVFSSEQQRVRNSSSSGGERAAEGKAERENWLQQLTVQRRWSSNTNSMARTTTVMNTPTRIEAGRQHFLILDAPSEDNLSAYIEEMKAFNVTDLVRTCERTYDDALVHAAGIRIHEWVFPDGEPPPDEVIDEWLDLCSSAAAAAAVAQHHQQQPPAIAVHCVAGLGRAPVLVAVALIEKGMDPMDAIMFIRERRKGAINRRQLQFLRNYRRRSYYQKCCMKGCTIM